MMNGSLGPFATFDTTGGLQTFSADARSLVRIVKKPTFTPPPARQLLPRYTPRSAMRREETFAKSGTVVFLLDVIGPLPTFAVLVGAAARLRQSGCWRPGAAFVMPKYQQSGQIGLSSHLRQRPYSKSLSADVDNTCHALKTQIERSQPAPSTNQLLCTQPLLRG